MLPQDPPPLLRGPIGWLLIVDLFRRARSPRFSCACPRPSACPFVLAPRTGRTRFSRPTRRWWRSPRRRGRRGARRARSFSFCVRTRSALNTELQTTAKICARNRKAGESRGGLCGATRDQDRRKSRRSGARCISRTSRPDQPRPRRRDSRSCRRAAASRRSS